MYPMIFSWLFIHGKYGYNELTKGSPISGERFQELKPWITARVSDGLSKGTGFEVHTFCADAEGRSSSSVMFQTPKLSRYDGITSQKTDEQTKNPMESSSEGALFQTQESLYLLSK